MALRESIVQVVHHVHVFTQLHAQHMSVQAIAITTTMRAVSAPRVLVLLCRAMLLSAHRVVIVHVATMARVVTSSARAVTASVHRVAMVSVHRVAMVSVLSRVVTAVLSRVVTVAHSRVVTVVHSRVVMVVLSRVATVVLSRVVTVAHSRVATASLTEHLLTRRAHVSTAPTTIQMQSTQ
jgi:hypothetical protein